MLSLHHLKKTSLWASIFVGICFTSVLIFLLFPYLFDLFLAPRIINKLSVPVGELSILRLTPWQLQGSIRLGNDTEPALVVPKFQLNFSPVELVNKNIKQLIIDSASIHLHFQDGRVKISGFESNGPATTQTSSTLPLLPLAVNNIVIRNSSITVHMEQGESKSFFINSQIKLSYFTTGDGQKRLDTIVADTEFTGDLQLISELELSTAPNGYTVNADIQIPELEQLEDLLPALGDITIEGVLALESSFTLSPSLQISGLKCSANLSRFTTHFPGISIHSISDTAPVSFSAMGNTQQIDFTLTGTRFSGPQNGSIETTGVMRPTEQILSSKTKLLMNDSATPIFLNMSGNWQQPTTEIEYRLSADEYIFNNQYHISPLSVEGDIAFSQEKVTAQLTGRVQKFVDKTNSFSLNDISFHLPLQFPHMQTPSDSGFIKIDQIKYKGKKGGSLKTELSQTSNGLSFQARFSDLLGQEISAQCNGVIDNSADLNGNCNLPPTEISTATFPDFIPIPEELLFTGEIHADAEFSITKTVPGGKLALALKRGVLDYGENKFSAINVSLNFPHLPTLRSEPSQIAQIDDIYLGDVHFSDADIQFRIEDDLSLFLEKAKANWCGGRLETGAIRIYQGMGRFSTTLHADRLDFSELIGQFGIENTEGEGSLNGKIPIEINDQGLVFDDGFLFSTPGNSGIIRFNDTEQLRQNIPGLEETSYLDYSMKALEDFSYNWTKLTFNNQGNDLLVALQLDGKPTTPLPFGYQKGQIIKTDKGPGLQHPIRLDVNFRLPLQDLFKYGKNIQSIMENL